MDEGRLGEAIALIDKGEKGQAMNILSDMVRREPKDDMVWFWLSVAVEDVDRKRFCLERAVSLNPNNYRAKAAILEFGNVSTNREQYRVADQKYVGDTTIADNTNKNSISDFPPTYPSTSNKRNDLRKEIFGLIAVLGVVLLILSFVYLIGLVGGPNLSIVFPEISQCNTELLNRVLQTNLPQPGGGITTIEAFSERDFTAMYYASSISDLHWEIETRNSKGCYAYHEGEVNGRVVTGPWELFIDLGSQKIRPDNQYVYQIWYVVLPFDQLSEGIPIR